MKVEETMLDVGMCYLSELAQRCMVQVQLTRFSRRIKLCRLHNLMWDLCLLKAQEENFPKVVYVEAFDNQQLKRENSASSSSSSPWTKIHRLAVYYLGDHDANNIRREYINLEELTNHHHLRSCQFYFFGNDLEISGWEQIKSLFKGFKLLRILDVEGIYIGVKGKKKLPRDIGNLFHLRYLNINESWIGSVPSSIGNLRFLETLDLRVYADEVTIEIPNVLCTLEQLRHLYLPYVIKLTGTSKLQLDGLSKLETLKAFVTEYCDVRRFPKLTNLRQVEVLSEDHKDLAVILKSPILLNNSNSLLLPSLSFSIVGDFKTEVEQSLLRQLLPSSQIVSRWVL
ncbi:putative disease resistance protein RXW24L [Camellia lanceoleosa]|uniref:Disease resistance protein RXW24L n=1 Tax=Camellia lanceoleosa TaxID=1840588 RepID=A0ACC0IQF2_9ERIC|nr:putative disease resistance protein RXW24L [Camellia lanceoleosa]